MGILQEFIQKRFKGQSHRPPTVRRGPPIVETTSDIAVEMGGRYGVSGPETWNINRRLENPSLYDKTRDQDMSVEGVVDLQLLDPQTKIQIQTGLRNRVKKVLKFLGDD